MAIPIGHQQIRDFSSGMMTETADSITPNNVMRLILNMDTSVIGQLQVRKGTTAIGDQLEDGKSILGLYQFKDSGAGAYSQQIAAVDNSGSTQSVTEYNNSGTWTGITDGGTFTAGAKYRFETFLDLVFMVNSAFDGPKSWNGNPASGWGTGQLTSAPAGEFIKVYKDRIYIAATSANPDRLYYSTVPDSNGDITWDTGATGLWIDINPEDGENITGLEENSTTLLIFKDQSMYRWNGSSTEADKIIDVGCSSSDSIATRHGKTFFFNPKGIYVTQGGYPQRISKPIQRWIDAIAVAYYNDVAGVCDEDHYYCSIGDVTVDGEAYTNVVLVYEISTQNWTVRSYAEQITVFANFIKSDGTEAVMVGNDDGDVQEFNSGDNDAGSAIVYRVKTIRLSFVNSFAYEKMFSEIHAFGRGLIGAQTIVHVEEDKSPRSIGELFTQWWMYVEGLKYRGRWFVFELTGTAVDTDTAEFWGWEITNGQVVSKGGK
uniref:Uncharacterized protein n=1 Tax=viral metagenome TaxID=1070528 RepID=A0A6M3Y3H8_9ZZZZ